MGTGKVHRGQELFRSRVRADRAKDDALGTPLPHGFEGLRHQCHDCEAYAPDTDLRVRESEGLLFFFHRPEAICARLLTEPAQP